MREMAYPRSFDSRPKLDILSAMKKKILLIDESLTVQKVVALTLDKAKYQLSFAKSRPEVMKLVLENPPDLILLSDQMSDMSVGNFPKEMET